VHVNGEPVELAPSELRILTILAASLGRIVSRAELVSGCWGELASVSDNALESVVKRLRKKLGTEAGRLQSVRLRGYVLVEPPP
jgi:DNA-binding response OmpR family regulator